MGLGRPGLLLTEGRAADRRALVCGVVGLSGAGIGDTPALVGCCGCCGRGGRLVVGAPACLVCVGVACCRGSGAVRPGCLTCLGLLVVVLRVGLVLLCWGLVWRVWAGWL